MMTPTEALGAIKKNIDGCAKASFLGAFITGLIVHMPALVSDIPNHDGLASICFDQDMLTSGRWFLGTACGISSFYAIPWFIGVLALVYIALAALFTVRIFGVKEPVYAGIIGMILAAFPTVASNFAYVFTMDGYMLGLLLCVLAVYVTDLGKWGFIAGAILLAFGVGTYQAYLAVAMILCLYKVVEILLESAKERKALLIARYPAMGALGLIIYYIVLRVKLLVTGKTLDDYQGIGAGVEQTGPIGRIIASCKDFVIFSLRSKIMAANPYAVAAYAILAVSVVVILIAGIVRAKLYKDIRLYIAIVGTAILLPVCADMILIANPSVTYHSLMRYQWAFILSIAPAVISRAKADSKVLKTAVWAGTVSVLVMVFSFAILDNISYGNLQKKYEKTYAYAVRLLDRIEETEGYVSGMPVKLIGVVGTESFPETDVTKAVTEDLLSMSGDFLLYRPNNYKLFMEHYLGATVNFVDEDADYYYADWYVDMHPFPAEDSIVIRDGVMYIKTENHTRN